MNWTLNSGTSRWHSIVSAAVFSLALSVSEYGYCAEDLMALNAPGMGSSLVYSGVRGNGLRALRFDAGTGQLSTLGAVAELPKARWGVAHPTLPILYMTSDDGSAVGKVTAFAVDRRSGALQAIGEQSTGGSGPTHLWLDAISKTLLVANYGGGSVSSIALNSDGSLGALVSTIQHIGAGPHRRQASPHAHGVFLDAGAKHVLVPDLGTDRIYAHGFDRESRKLTEAGAEHAFVAAAGSGPRHLVFSKDQRFVHVLSELTAELTSLRWDAVQGQFAPVQSLPTHGTAFTGTKSGSEIASSQDGRFIYVGNRGENQLQVYAANAESGELTLIQTLACGGENPWTFALHSSGRWLLVANERSNRVNVFRVDAQSGKLTDTGQSAESPAPISLTFVD
ncbi:lactonase family protein [Diaphorobacter sp. HDW4A]|uniref:lactonase family protein n=1 Tax=Diaphorobacter sp. HDW4A TaxID=2714924 RepID=UPI0014098E7C|nr:lactonase family protein [Diaphorobacter sp. HDW4A]QIL79280.1 lactonase family protein [Diaphorobacter sp. HDW4A]